MAYNYRSHLWLFLLLITVSVTAQNSGLTGLPKIYNYPPTLYGYHPQNWSAVQDGRGMMYFANTDGILEYDGINWRMIRMPQGEVCRTLFRASDGTIYAGGYNEIGRLVSDHQGKTEYQSLRSSISGLPAEFYDVWSIAELNGSIYFATYNNIFILRENRITNAGSQVTINGMMNIDGRIIVVRTGRLPEVLTGTEFRPLVNDGLQPAGKSYTVVKGSANPLIAIGKKGDFHKIEGGRITQLSSGLDIFDEINNFYDALRLSDGTIAIATIRKGMVICSEDGTLLRVLDESKGYGNNTVYSLYEDNRKNLWATLENGLSRINISDPISIFDKRVSLPGSIGDVAFSGDRFFVVTNFGVYSSQLTNNAEKSVFSRYPGEIGDGWRIKKTGNDLYAVAANGLFILRNNSAIRLDDAYSIDYLIPGEAPDVVLLSTISGLKVLKTDGSRSKVLTSFMVKGVESELRSVVQRKKGEFWINTSTGNLIRLKFTKGFDSQPEVVTYTEKDQKIGHHPQIIVLNGEVLVATGKGLHFFDDKENRFVTLVSKGFIESTDPLSYPLITGFRLGMLIVYNEGNLYTVSVDIPAGSCSFNRFGRVRSSSVYRLVYDDINAPGQLWMATSSGLFRYALTGGHSDQKTNTVIRSVTVTDSLHYFGVTLKGEEIAIEPDNTVTITYSTLGITDEANVLFQTWMEGIDTSWQPLTKNSFREFAKLGPGNYTFRVRAMLPTGEIAEEASISIDVASYWYANIYAYVIYILIFSGGFLLFNRTRTVKLRKERVRLETAVNERTKELKEAIDEINSRNALLKETNSKLEKLDKEKSEYLGIVAHDLKSPILGIMGFAEIISDDISDLENEDVKRFAQNIVASSGKMVETINRLLDVNMIEEGKIELRIEEFDLVDLMSDTVSLIIPNARKKNITINFRSDRESLPLESDRSLCGQIFDNILSNALKYSYPGTEVKVRVKLGGSMAIVEIEDKGQGIAQHEIPLLFEKFRRLSSKPTAGESSSGLGLAIVKSLTELLEGEIKVNSTPGQGSTFIVELPLKFEKSGD